MENVAPESELDEELSFPKSWKWDEDGDAVFGHFLRVDRGRTRDYGAKTIVVLEIDGTERSVWLTGDVLFAKFREELLDRPGRTLTIGERVAIRRHEPKESEAGRKYRPFTVLFPDRPQPTTATLFDLDEPTPTPTPASEESSGNVAEPSDDIPF